MSNAADRDTNNTLRIHRYANTDKKTPSLTPAAMGSR